MFSFKEIAPIASPQAIARKEFLELEQNTLQKTISQRIKESIILKGHERSARRLESASCAAKQKINNLDNMVQDCRGKQRQFFSARRRIAEAACKQAKVASIPMEMVDYDSDEERKDFFSNTTTANTKWGSALAEHTFKQGSFVTKKFVPKVPTNIWYAKVHKEYSFKKSPSKTVVRPTFTFTKLDSMDD